ncbi:hypothetical protein PPERSA_09008 [Pseudocohnilembus persalinus]|uniref:carnosine N-methyltransferase n=1 Tax=Pseudocohnilembus persalinus TaxID=266149 RepID=A0A0V0R3W6_PSEPJ|nr:hypothetical protein PPERSA_09008 [Pseudocohnilembus persalinus]|eukprot:KRX08904.1 hypothetical protein PPERSA_09008 [Pseudocohnilembus persalinus]
MDMFMNDPEEKRHFVDILMSFYNYQMDSAKDIAIMERDFFNMSEKSKQFLMASPMNISKMRSTLKQIAREWSTEGKEEREASFGPIKKMLQQYFPNPVKENGDRVKVLFPGCGLGRLVFDAASMGFYAQGNEFSYHMLITSGFILNEMEKANQFQLRPYILNFCNQYKEEDPFKVYNFPDVFPGDEIKPEWQNLSMVAGDFREVYSGQKGEWDCIVTCFFIDTANNIIEKGGVWINLGPLQYHYHQQPDQLSIELSYEEILLAAEKIGFSIENKYEVDSSYVGCQKNMNQLIYKCQGFAGVKKDDKFV